MKFPKQDKKRSGASVPLQRRVLEKTGTGTPFFTVKDVNRGVDLLVQLLRAIFVHKKITIPQFADCFIQYKEQEEGIQSRQIIDGDKTNLVRALRQRRTVSWKQFNRAMTVIGYVPKDLKIVLEDKATGKDVEYSLNELRKKVLQDSAETEADRISVVPKRKN